MKINNILTLGTFFTALLANFTATARPHPELEADTSQVGTILFRVENIKPIKNQDDIIDKCSYVVTVYNRMDKALKEANLTLQWVDNIAQKYSVINGEIKTNGAEDAKTVVSSQIKLTAIDAHKQKSFEQTVETDKCFLLLDNLTYKVDTCATDSEKVIMKDSKVISKGDCLGNFNYIDSRNPEYYSEFKDVPSSVLEKQAEEEKLQELKKINEMKDQALQNLEDANTTLEQIK